MRGPRPPHRLGHVLRNHHDAVAAVVLVAVLIGFFVSLLWITDDAIRDVIIHASGTV